MEEKERYSYDYFIDGAVFIDTENDRDMDMDTVCSLLNQQNERIKELEEENQQLKDQARKAYQEGLLQKQFDKDMEIQELKDKIEQLKKSQKQIAISELRRIKEYILINDKYDEEVGCNIIETFDLLEEIRDRIEKLGGGENE